jgi:hypothetical protein
MRTADIDWQYDLCILCYVICLRVDYLTSNYETVMFIRLFNIVDFTVQIITVECEMTVW